MLVVVLAAFLTALKPVFPALFTAFKSLLTPLVQHLQRPAVVVPSAKYLQRPLSSLFAEDLKRTLSALLEDLKRPLSALLKDLEGPPVVLLTAEFFTPKLFTPELFALVLFTLVLFTAKLFTELCTLFATLLLAVLFAFLLFVVLIRLGKQNTSDQAPSTHRHAAHPDPMLLRWRRGRGGLRRMVPAENSAEEAFVMLFRRGSLVLPGWRRLVAGIIATRTRGTTALGRRATSGWTVCCRRRRGRTSWVGPACYGRLHQGVHIKPSVIVCVELGDPSGGELARIWVGHCGADLGKNGTRTEAF
ncbi:hypothetical protein K438DRAFT_1807683 [Mycena galopus ATCC 62051]|nr:hypothetical protein K438DRAFT_1807683 [Mycena galopus ATCC 62051]